MMRNSNHLCLPISSLKVTSGTYLLPLAVAKQQRSEGKQSILAGSHLKEGCAKLNVDAATARDSRDGAVGVVCRLETGLFLGASMLKIQGVSDPVTLEAMACREALALAQDLNLQRVTVATDCLSVVNDLARPMRVCTTQLSTRQGASGNSSGCLV
jgi:hypothetical protein